MADLQTLEVPVAGMDCAECTQHVQQAIAGLPGVENVQVYLGSEKAVVTLDPHLAGLPAIRQAVEKAGYSVPEAAAGSPVQAGDRFTRSVLTLLGVVFGAVLFVVVAGEMLGLFETLTARIPWPFWLAAVLAGGYPVFRNVVRAALRGQVISHTLMTLGVIAALAVGEWATAAVVVFFMRVGDYVERFTTERARRAVRDLAALAPQTARMERDGVEVEIPLGEVRHGDIVIVRPGEKIPVDGEVVAGQAAVDQATITGESLPLDAGPGAYVYAASLLLQGSLRLRVEHVGADTTFGRVIRLVEQAEAQRADVQRVADKFSAYYLPVVAGIAALTFLIRRDPLATAAVLVVACSCSFALATPIAILASIGAGARRGLMIKGGKYLERLAQADVLLIDKTGTLTLGRPQIVDFQYIHPDFERQAADGRNSKSEIIYLAASAERYSEHPLAEALRQAAREAALSLGTPDEFENTPGMGVRARLDGRTVLVGNRRLMETSLNGGAPNLDPILAEYREQGMSMLFVALDGELIGLFSARDRPRPEVPAALRQVRALGIRRIEILTGDNEQTARALAGWLGDGVDVEIRADLLPEDKIRIVREYQERGHVVVMVGDGVNDAPALAQADVGIAMRSARGAQDVGAGAARGSDLAVEAAHIALMRDDWLLVPGVIRIARRTMGVVKTNIAFTALYNLVGLSLAALGFLPPVLAAAAQSLPDLGILANSARLLRQKP
jgi:Cd2+/Zn2+-exporting ATPase/Cu+-exporting ATPase